MPLNDDDIRVAKAAIEPLVGRRLIEAGQYMDGGPLLMLVFADHPGQTHLDPERRDRVRWAISGYEDWTLFDGEEAIARRGDSDEIDAPRLAPVLGQVVLSGDVTPAGGMCLLFAKPYRFEFLAPASGSVNDKALTRWSITTPIGVVSLVGNAVVQES